MVERRRRGPGSYSVAKTGDGYRVTRVPPNPSLDTTPPILTAFEKQSISFVLPTYYYRHNQIFVRTTNEGDRVAKPLLHLFEAGIELVLSNKDTHSGDDWNGNPEGSMIEITISELLNAETIPRQFKTRSNNKRRLHGSNCSWERWRADGDNAGRTKHSGDRDRALQCRGYFSLDIYIKG